MLPYLYSKKAIRLCPLVVLLFLFQMGMSMAVEKYTTKNENFSFVDFKDGLLKVSVERQKFKDIMGEIAKKAEIEIVFNYSGDEEITINFDYLPLEKGLRQLLREKNYAFKYQAGEDNDSKNSCRTSALR